MAFIILRTHKDLFTYKEVGKEIRALGTQGGKGAAGNDRTREASKYVKFKLQMFAIINPASLTALEDANYSSLEDENKNSVDSCYLAFD